MRAIKTFLHVLGNSLLPTDKYYKKIPETKLSFSLKYFFTLIFVITFITNLATIGLVYPKNGVATIKKNIDSLFASYPKDLYINVAKGNLTTSLPRVYKFYMADYGSPTIVIDEKADVTKLMSYKAVVAINNNSVVYKNFDKDNIEVTPIDKNSDLKISYASVSTFKKNLGDIYNLMPFVWIIVVFLTYLIIPFVATAVKISYLLFISLLVFLIFKIFVRKLQVMEVFHLSLHAASLPTILGALISLSAFGLSMQMLFFALTFVFVVAAVYETHVYKE